MGDHWERAPRNSRVYRNDHIRNLHNEYWVQDDTVKLDVSPAAYLPEYDKVGPWPADDPKRPGSWVIMGEGSNHHLPWIREYPRELHQKVVEMGLGALPVYSRIGCF